jgi:hypothetical protein
MFAYLRWDYIDNDPGGTPGIGAILPFPHHQCPTLDDENYVRAHLKDEPCPRCGEPTDSHFRSALRGCSICGNWW